MVKFVQNTKVSTPKFGQTYRFIGVPGAVRGNLSLKIGRRVWDGGKNDLSRLAMNNVFITLEAALQTRREIARVLNLTVKKIAG